MDSRSRTYHLYLLQGLRISVLFACLSSLTTCVEPFEGVDFIENFENVLVVNATMTNELKQQEVLLTRSFRFDQDEAMGEEDAQVSISVSDGQVYTFEEDSPGKYISSDIFGGELNKEYTLNITTNDGRTYISEPMSLPVANTSIDNLYAERIVNDDGEDGITIMVDSFDPSGTSRLYRHEFIETFKIIAPFWSPLDAVVVIEGISTITIDAILREQEERICYGTDREKNILINTTLGLSEDRLSQYPVRFINRDNYILTHRYSVLVRQYVQSPQAFSFYETLRGLSQTTGNVFSEDQPGFLQGNISSLDDPRENVAGFFEVAAVDEKRIFFDYEDFFPGEESPPYVADCVISAPTTQGSFGQRPLLNLIYDDKIRFYDFNTGQIPGGGPYLVVRKECGDCTALGSNKVPEFWIE